MIRDARMQALVAADKEPIRPFISRVRSLWSELGVSKSPHEYVAVACQYLQLLLAQFGVPEVNKLLKDLLKKAKNVKRIRQENSLFCSLS